MKRIYDYYTEEINVNGIKLIRKEAIVGDFKPGKYDGVIFATGAITAVPPIKGLKEYYWTDF